MVHSARIGVTRDASYINAAGFCETGFEKQKPALFAVWTFIENPTEAKRSKLGVLLDEASTVGKAYAKCANLKDGAQRMFLDCPVTPGNDEFASVIPALA